MLDLELLSLKELKAEFTRITQFPAKKAFVAIACPSLASCSFRSKADWIMVVESIEQILSPVFDCPCPTQPDDTDRLSQRITELEAELEERSRQVAALEAETEEQSQQIAELESAVETLRFQEANKPRLEQPEDALALYLSEIPEESAQAVLDAVLVDRQSYRRLAPALHPDTSAIAKDKAAALFAIASRINQSQSTIVYHEQSQPIKLKTKPSYQNEHGLDDLPF